MFCHNVKIVKKQFVYQVKTRLIQGARDRPNLFGITGLICGVNCLLRLNTLLFVTLCSL